MRLNYFIYQTKKGRVLLILSKALINLLSFQFPDLSSRVTDPFIRTHWPIHRDNRMVGALLLFRAIAHCENACQPVLETKNHDCPVRWEWLWGRINLPQEKVPKNSSLMMRIAPATGTLQGSTLPGQEMQGVERRLSMLKKEKKALYIGIGGGGGIGWR